MTDLVRLE